MDERVAGRFATNSSGREKSKEAKPLARCDVNAAVGVRLTNERL
jgi:hypothetical protein